MRVLQLIDSLNIGGAERIAVNFANALVSEIDRSYLCVTRQEGDLKTFLYSDVNYLFLEKKKTVDLKAFKKLKKFVKHEKIDIIHAHSSSYFTAYIIKKMYPKVKVIWHNHFGNSHALKGIDYKILKLCSLKFSHIYCVNEILVDWAKELLNTKSVSFLLNFTELDNNAPLTFLHGNEGKRIVCLANFRSIKGHEILLKAFKIVSNKNNDWSLHCVGKNFEDEYYKNILGLVSELELKQRVYLYNSKTDVANILSQAEIGVLSSKSEGLPLALLEYGLSSLAVVCTNVGYCSTIIANGSSGVLVEKEDALQLANAILDLIQSNELRNRYSENLNKSVVQNFGKTSVVEKMITDYKAIINES